MTNILASYLEKNNLECVFLPPIVTEHNSLLVVMLLYKFWFTLLNILNGQLRSLGVPVSVVKSSRRRNQVLPSA